MDIEGPQKPLEGLKQKFIKDLRRLITGYKDGIPDEIKHSTKDSGWKVQKLWFSDVAGVLVKMKLEQEEGNKIVSDEFFNELGAYYFKLTKNDNPFKYRDTTQADIDEAEVVINKAIAELKK